MSTLDWEFLKQAAEFVGMDRKMKLCLLAGAVGAEASDDEKEMARAIGAKISPKKPDWKDAIRKCGVNRISSLGCCLNNNDPVHCDNWPLRWAAERGHLEVVQLLLADKRVDPSANKQYSLRAAVEYGHETVARLLLQDPRVDVDAAIATAKEYGEYGISKTLAGLKKLQE